LSLDVEKNFNLLNAQMRSKLAQIFEEEQEPAFSKGSNSKAVMARARAQKAIAAITKTSALLSTRAAAGASVAANRGYTEQQLAAYEAIAQENPGWVVKKVWTANFTNNTPCPTCAALHGTTIEISEVFSDLQSYKKAPGIYQDLAGPPRHVNCKCRLTIHVEQDDVPLVKETKGEKSPAAMRTYTKSRAKEIDAPKGISSQQIRDMPESEFSSFLKSLVDKFKKWFKGKSV
jgi:hypothetical protein